MEEKVGGGRDGVVFSGELAAEKMYAIAAEG